jgi:mono/diheme cytochrome c family protein
VAGVVRQQIENVRRGSAMPADLVTGQDARDVAAYVAGRRAARG